MRLCHPRNDGTPDLELSHLAGLVVDQYVQGLTHNMFRWQYGYAAHTRAPTEAVSKHLTSQRWGPDAWAMLPPLGQFYPVRYLLFFFIKYEPASEPRQVCNLITWGFPEYTKIATLFLSDTTPTQGSKREYLGDCLNFK